MIRGTEIAWNLPELVQPGMGIGVRTAGEGWAPTSHSRRARTGRKAGSELALCVGGNVSIRRVSLKVMM